MILMLKEKMMWYKIIGSILLGMLLSGCQDDRVEDLQVKLPEGCKIMDIGRYKSIGHVLVVTCEGKSVSSVNYSWCIGKQTLNGFSSLIE